MHHSVVHVLAASGQCLDSSPNVNWHCLLASYSVPGKSEGSWMGLWGLSNKHSPEKVGKKKGKKKRSQMMLRVQFQKGICFVTEAFEPICASIFVKVRLF